MSILVTEFIKNPKAILLLAEMDLEPNENQQLSEEIWLLYHQTLLNHLLDELDEEKKRLFLEKHLTSEQESAIVFLRENIVNIEEIAQKAALELEVKIASDFENLREEKN